MRLLVTDKREEKKSSLSGHISKQQSDEIKGGGSQVYFHAI